MIRRIMLHTLSVTITCNGYINRTSGQLLTNISCDSHVTSAKVNTESIFVYLVWFKLTISN